MILSKSATESGYPALNYKKSQKHFTNTIPLKGTDNLVITLLSLLLGALRYFKPHMTFISYKA